jgi:hypothetical protein
LVDEAMNELRQVIDELHRRAEPQAEEIAHAARPLNDGLPRLDTLFYSRQLASRTEMRPRWVRMRRTVRHSRRLAAYALRAIWQP